MPIIKLTIEDYVNAILDRDEGISYPEVLRRYNITPNQFAKAVNHKLEEYIEFTEGSVKETLKSIKADNSRKIELFYMGEEFVAAQFDRIMTGKQERVYYGTYLHPKNIEYFVYRTFTLANPKLGSQDRKEVINAIMDMPPTLQDYLHSLRLIGLMSNFPEKEERGSPLAVLKAFDRAYQRKTGNKSIFDLSQADHLHEWGDRFCAPNSYWKSKSNVETAIYHTLCEKHPNLKSNNRKVIIDTIKELPSGLLKYFYSLGFCGLMTAGFKKGDICSPLAILKRFDKTYRRITGDESLFDLNQKEHLHEWGDNYRAPSQYWQNPLNVENAIYHTLTEQIPSLGSKDRPTVISSINSLPTQLSDYLKSIGLGGLMVRSFKEGNRGSPLAVLKAFDMAFQRITGNKSLFDQDQKEHLHEWGDKFVAQRNYWQNPLNVENAIYHILIENHQGLTSEIRSEVILAIKTMPKDLFDYMVRLNLHGLMMTAFDKGEKSSPLAVLKAFDRAYQRRTGDISLFDSTQKDYLEISKQRIVK